MKRRVSTRGVPCRASGSRPCVVSIFAPKARNCAATGSIGRRRKDASPSKRALRLAPAHAPRSILAVDPEFMHSKTRARRTQPRSANPHLEAVRVDANAQCPERFQRRANVAPRVEICDAQRFGAAGSGNQRPVRNRLVAWHGDAAVQPPGSKVTTLGGIGADLVTRSPSSFRSKQRRSNFVKAGAAFSDERNR